MGYIFFLSQWYWVWLCNFLCSPLADRAPVLNTLDLVWSCVLLPVAVRKACSRQLLLWGSLSRAKLRLQLGMNVKYILEPRQVFWDQTTTPSYSHMSVKKWKTDICYGDVLFVRVACYMSLPQHLFRSSMFQVFNMCTGWYLLYTYFHGYEVIN